LFPVTQTRKTKIPGKYPVIVGLCPAKISENGVIKAFKKTQKAAGKALLNGENRFWAWYYHGTFCFKAILMQVRGMCNHNKTLP
jgi:hypothetical protein